MIVKLHGTSGAGKTTLARAFLKNPLPFKNEKGKIEGYKCEGYPFAAKPLYILGSYENVCGGCDGLSASRQIELLHQYAPKGHLIYEGLLASEYYGKLGEASERYRQDHIFAFLDTPIEVCIERVKARRIVMGNLKPFNETNTRERIKKIESLKRKLIFMGRPVVTLNYLNAEEMLREIFVYGYDEARRRYANAS